MAVKRTFLIHNVLRHHLHPLYIYCRLRFFIPKKQACRICRWYEYHSWRWIEKLINLFPYDNERGCD